MMSKLSTAVYVGLAAGILVGVPLAIEGTPIENITEDSPDWDCVMDGNHVCGPNNPQGKPAACYDDGGVMVKAWPCNPWEPNMGHRHGDGTTTYPNGDVLTDDGEEA
jgi:hypothetical protein